MFKVGDKILCLNNENRKEWFTIGKNYKITNFNSHGNPIVKDNEGDERDTAYAKKWEYKGKKYIFEDSKIVEEVTKDLRTRIEAVTAWDKEADDIRKEIQGDYNLIVESFSHGGLNIYIKNNKQETVQSVGTSDSRCRKLELFKDALLWLAEKAGKLEDKSKIKEELEKISEEYEAIGARITELKKRL